MRDLFIVFLLLSHTLLWAEEEAGYGWNVPNSSLNIGGYLDMTYDEKRDEKFLFNDIAILFSANQERFDLLGEVELSHISLDGKSNSSTDVDLNIERLQLSYALSDEQSVQVGRFNSDVGFWNQAPILILQETTTEPQMVGSIFPKATTGLLYRQDINTENSFSLTFQKNRDLAHQDEQVEVDQHYGVAYHGSKNELSWRLSAGQYSDTHNIESNYIGVGSLYDGERFMFQAELFGEDADNDDANAYSGYLQSTWHFQDKQDAVVRFESYRDNELEVKEQIYLLGYAYRPTNNTAIKGEYIYHSELPLNRFVYSLSVLF